MVFWIKAGIPLAAGVAVILLFEGGSSDVVRFSFGAICFLVGYGISWANAHR